MIMRFKRLHSSSHTSFSKLTDHVLPPQSHLRPNHKYPSNISAGLAVITDTHTKKGGFTRKSTSEISLRYPLKGNLSLKASSRANQKYPTTVFASLGNITDNHIRPRYAQNSGLLNWGYRSVGTHSFVNGASGYRAYSSFFGSNGDNSVVKGLSADNSGGIGNDGVDSLKNVWRSIVNAADFTGQKIKDAADTLTPHVQQLLDSHPYVNDVIIPVSWTLTGTLLAWLVMPKVLRKFHKYSMQTPAALLSGISPQGHVSYEKSFWGSLEDPVRYLVTYMAFSQLAEIIAPTTVASQFIAQSWRGAIILSSIWFIHRWKTNVFTHVLSAQNLVALDRERMLALHKATSLGLFVLGVMALAEAYGVAVQSILTVGGIGGIATAIAARSTLENILSGLSWQFSKPFSLGDTIKAGSIEGKVVEMGLTHTLLLNAEKHHVKVPNSLFSSQGIVNKSRAKVRATVTKFPIRFDSLEKVPQISAAIKSMLKANAKIFLGEEVPYCIVSQTSPFPELTIGYNLQQMSKDEFYATEQDILLQAFRIIKEHGALEADVAATSSN